VLRATALTIGLATLAFAGQAGAQPYLPPEGSAVNQYTEGYPSAGGNVPSSGGGGHRTATQVLGKNKAARLEALGTSGEGAAQLAAAGAPAAVGRPAGQSGGAGRPEGSGGSSPSPSLYANPPGESGVKQVLGQIAGSSSGETGLLLPLLMVASLIAALAFAAARRRSAAGE